MGAHGREREWEIVGLPFVTAAVHSEKGEGRGGVIDEQD
jgi:hypothetical protein